jgi:hypothetical protein
VESLKARSALIHSLMGSRLYCMYCGETLPNDHKGTCPNCGKEGGSAKVEGTMGFGTGHQETATSVTEYLKKNQLLFVILLVITLGAPILGFFVSGFFGLLAGLALGLLCFFLSPYAIMKIRDTRIEHS